MAQPSELWPEIWELKRKVKSLTGEDEPTYVYAPYSLSVYGGYRSIHISWQHKNSSRAIRTEVWTSTTADRADASMVGRVEGQTFAVHDLEPLQLWHVWIRTVNVAIESGGEFTQVSDWVGPETGTTKAVELEDFPEIVIEESVLAPLLNEKIKRIDGLDDDLHRVGESLVDLLVEEDKGKRSLAAVIEETRTELVEGLGAEAEARQTVVARIDGDIGGVQAVVETNSTAIANLDGTVQGLWTVRVDANGKVAGIGLVSDGATSEFAIRADRFFMLTDNATGEQQQVFQIADGQLVFYGDIFAASMTRDGLMTGGKIVGDKIYAQSEINLNSGGKLVIGTGGILSVGTSAYLSATRAAFNVSQFIIQNGPPGSSGGTVPFFVESGVVYMNMAMIKSASITNALIENAAITNAKIENGAITNAKIANATIESAKIKDGEITNAKIASLAVDSAKIANGSITNAKIADAAITTAKIQDAAIENANIKNLTVDGKKISANAVSNTYTAYGSGGSIDGYSRTICSVTVSTGDTGGTSCKVLCQAVGSAWGAFKGGSPTSYGRFSIGGGYTTNQEIAHYPKGIAYNNAATGFCVCAESTVSSGSTTIEFIATGQASTNGVPTECGAVTLIVTLLKK